VNSVLPQFSNNALRTLVVSWTRSSVTYQQWIRKRGMPSVFSSSDTHTRARVSAVSETLTDTVHLVNIATYVARRQSIGMRTIRRRTTSDWHALHWLRAAKNSAAVKRWWSAAARVAGRPV